MDILSWFRDEYILGASFSAYFLKKEGEFLGGGSGGKWQSNGVRSSSPARFLRADEKKFVLTKIYKMQARGLVDKVRVVLTKKMDLDIVKAAEKTFVNLGLTEAKQRTGLLVYLNIHKKQFVIIGGREIHRKIKFSWDNLVKEMEKIFKAGSFGDGIFFDLDFVEEMLKRI